jgi:hypothetical protein
LTQVIWQAAASLLDTRVPNDWLLLRLLGVGATGLVRDLPVQGHLFEDDWRAKQHALDSTVDAIRRQFGRSAIRRAQGMEKQTD